MKTKLHLHFFAALTTFTTMLTQSGCSKNPTDDHGQHFLQVYTESSCQRHQRLSLVEKVAAKTSIDGILTYLLNADDNTLRDLPICTK